MLPKPQLRNELLLPKRAYGALMVSNLMLRLSWLHKLSRPLRRSRVAAVVFATLEVHRRWHCSATVQTCALYEPQHARLLLLCTD